MHTMTDGRMQDLIDRSDITTLVHRLGTALDEGRFEDLRSLFVSDASAKTPGGEAKGVEAMIAQASRNHSADRRVQHVITDVLVDLDADEATVRANLLVSFVSGPVLAAPSFTMGEVYRFEAVRTEGAWRLSRVETTPVWSIGVPPIATAGS